MSHKKRSPDFRASRRTARTALGNAPARFVRHRRRRRQAQGLVPHRQKRYPKVTLGGCCKTRRPPRKGRKTPEKPCNANTSREPAAAAEARAPEATEAATEATEAAAAAPRSSCTSENLVTPTGTILCHPSLSSHR